VSLKGPVRLIYTGQLCGTFKGKLSGWFDGVMDAELVIEWVADTVHHRRSISHSS
jgi:hypothetical protein